jgi:hypothetical protein
MGADCDERLDSIPEPLALSEDDDGAGRSLGNIRKLKIPREDKGLRRFKDVSAVDERNQWT